MPRLILLLLVPLASFTSLAAQQYGHLNFANLLAQMPGITAAEAELEKYNQELIGVGEEMVEALRTRVSEVEAQVEDLPPVRVRELQVEFNSEREKIGQYEQQMSIDLEKKRQELLGPLIRQAREAIEVVAKENGYQLVFDTSIFNTVLFAEDSDDLMPLVKAKLGM